LFIVISVHLTGGKFSCAGRAIDGWVLKETAWRKLNRLIWVERCHGNSFAVINSELRFPVFKYLMNRPLKSDFISNFQIIGFGDLVSAWTGSNPYDDKNAYTHR
jgi:hypothetical protein